MPLVTVGSPSLSAVLDAAGFVLVVLVFVNLGLLATFGPTLRRDPPMIECFARLQEPELSGAKAAWCRIWTWIGCGLLHAERYRGCGPGAVWALALVDARQGFDRLRPDRPSVCRRDCASLI